MYPLQLIVAILLVIGIGFWSFSDKDVSFFGSPHINIEPGVNMNLDLDLERPEPDVPSGLNNASCDDNEAPSLVILVGVVTAILVAMLPFPRWYGE